MPSARNSRTCLQLLLPALLVSTASIASGAPAEPRVTLLLDLADVETSGQGFDVGLEASSGAGLGGKLVRLDLGRSVMPRLAIVFHGPEGNHFSLSYRRYDRNESQSFSSSTGFFPTLNSPGTGIDFANEISSSADVTMDTVDAVWAHAMVATDRSEVRWGAGLRWLKYRSDWTTHYDGRTDNVMITQDSSGIGLTFGVQGSYKLSDRFSLRGGVGVGFVKGSTDASYREQNRSTLPLLPALTTEIERNDEDRVFQTLDLAARIVYSVSSAFDLSLGYQFARTTNLITYDRMVDDVLPGDISSTTPDVTFDGFLLGLAFNW